MDNEDLIHDYQIWTQEYPENEKSKEKATSTQIKHLYSIQIEAAKQSFSVKTVSEYIQIFETMMRCGIQSIQKFILSFLYAKKSHRFLCGSY